MIGFHKLFFLIMNIILAPLLQVTLTILYLYKWTIILGAILSILQAFSIINGHNRFVLSINDFIFRITEPLLSPIRRFIPLVGSIDLSALVLILAISFIEGVLTNVLISISFSGMANTMFNTFGAGR